MVGVAMLGLVKISDLLIMYPDLISIVDEAQAHAIAEDELADTLQKEAETKLKNAAARKLEVKRTLDAVARFRWAVGEKKAK